jgi:alpha-glucosidase
LRDPVGDLYWPYTAGRDGCRTPMPWGPGANLGFSEGEPWLPAATEHTGLTVADQEDDPDSVLLFAREMLAFRKGSPAMRCGDIEFLDLEGPVLAFVRRSDEEAIACLFNLSAEPQFVAHDILAQGDLWPVRAGDADLRGASLGLSSWGAAFLRLT